MHKEGQTGKDRHQARQQLIKGHARITVTSAAALGVDFLPSAFGYHVDGFLIASDTTVHQHLSENISNRLLAATPPTYFLMT